MRASSTSQPLRPIAESFGNCPNAARMPPSISGAVRNRSHVSVTGSTVRSTMASAIGSTPQNAGGDHGEGETEFPATTQLMHGGRDHGARFYRTRASSHDQPLGRACPLSGKACTG